LLCSGKHAVSATDEQPEYRSSPSRGPSCLSSNILEGKSTVDKSLDTTRQCTVKVERKKRSSTGSSTIQYCTLPTHFAAFGQSSDGEGAKATATHESRQNLMLPHHGAASGSTSKESSRERITDRHSYRKVPAKGLQPSVQLWYVPAARASHSKAIRSGPGAWSLHHLPYPSGRKARTRRCPVGVSVWRAFVRSVLPPQEHKPSSK